MPEYRPPGVYIEEVPSGARPIERVATDVAGFVGLAESGPTTPQRITSWSAFHRTYGGHIDESYLSRAVEGFFLNGGRQCWIARVVPSHSRARVADYLADPAAPAGSRTGLAALAEIDDIALLSVPDEVRREPVDLRPITGEVIDWCERLGDRFALVSALAGQRDPATLSPPRNSSHAAFYYPWIQVDDAATGRLHIPPTGHVAGVFARTDLTRGVHKAPAGELVRGAAGLELPVTTATQELLNPRGVNCLRDFRDSGRGIVVWGARTMSSDPEWRYIAVRRLALMIEKSIDKGTEWVVFEPNDEPLWASLVTSLGAFLINLWRDGALQGTQPDEAFFVRCDRTTMTASDIAEGRLIWLVGFAPLKPAEFVILRMEKKLGS